MFSKKKTVTNTLCFGEIVSEKIDEISEYLENKDRKETENQCLEKKESNKNKNKDFTSERERRTESKS